MKTAIQCAKFEFLPNVIYIAVINTWSNMKMFNILMTIKQAQPSTETRHQIHLR